ncbi:hypothetical protein VPH35_027393 [Triticum aestivum]
MYFLNKKGWISTKSHIESAQLVDEQSSGCTYPHCDFLKLQYKSHIESAQLVDEQSSGFTRPHCDFLLSQMNNVVPFQLQNFVQSRFNAAYKCTARTNFDCRTCRTLEEMCSMTL